MTRDTISLLDQSRSVRGSGSSTSSLVLKVKIAGCCARQDEGRIDGLTFFGAGSNGRTIKFSQGKTGLEIAGKVSEHLCRFVFEYLSFTLPTFLTELANRQWFRPSPLFQKLKTNCKSPHWKKFYGRESSPSLLYPPLWIQQRR